MTRLVRTVASRKRLTVAGIVVVFLAAAMLAGAYFSSTGSGTGSANAGSLNAPTNQTASATGANVTVEWDAALLSNGVPAQSYTVERYTGAGADDGPACSGTTILSSSGNPDASGHFTCTDTPGSGGTYKYEITATFNSWTATSAFTNTITFVADATPPTSSITFPASGAFYNTSAYNAGCSTPGTGDVCGTANDPGAGATGVNKVQVAIQRSTDSKYWNGTTWVTGVFWNDASGTTSWSYGFDASNLVDGVSYAVMSQAIDNASNTQTTPDSKTFTFDTTAPTLTSINRAGTNPTNTGPLNWTVTFSEPVNGVTTSNFSLATSGTGGSAPTISSATASGGAPSATWTVSVSTSGTTGTDSGSIRLDLANNSGVSDRASNALSTSSFTGQAYTYDTTAPTLTSINRAGTNPTNSGPLTWTVTFSEPVNGVTNSNFSLATSGTGGSAPTISSTIAVGGAPSATWTVSVSTSGTTGSNSGSIGLNLANNTGVTDVATNALSTASFTGQAYAYDTTAPTVSTINIAGTSPTNATTLPFTVTFSEPVNTAAVVVARFAVTTSGVTGTAPTVGTITPISPSGGFATSYTVNVNTTGAVGANNGSVRLDQTSSGTIADQAGNGLTGTHNGDQSYNYDTTAPTVSTINRAAGSTNPTNVGPLAFTVTFSEPVNTAAVVAARFAVTTSGVTGTAPTVGTITPVSPSGGFASVYTVNVNTTGAVGANNGSVRLDLTTAGTIQDQATNGLAGTPHNGDQSYNYDTTAPTVSTINIAGTSPTNAATLPFTVTFSEPVNTAAVVAARFAVTTSGVTGTAPTVGTITPISPSGGFATSYTVNVNTTGAVGANNGSVRLDQTSSGTIADQAGNGLTGTHNGDQSYNYDTTAPTVTINQAAGQADPTGASPINFTVVFTESTTDFATGDVTLSGTAGATTATVTGSGTTYNVAVTGMTTNGTVIATVGAGVAHDAAGNANTASTSTDNTVTYQNVLTPTAVTITNGSGGTAGKAEAGDVITITWNRSIQLSSVCSSWSNDTQTVTAVNVVMARGNGSATKDLSFNGGTVSPTACTGGIKIGTMTLPNGSSDSEPNNSTDTFANSTVTWNSSTNQLVITLGAPNTQPPNTVATTNYTYTPSSSIAAVGGSPTATGTTSTGSVQNF